MLAALPFSCAGGGGDGDADIDGDADVDADADIDADADGGGDGDLPVDGDVPLADGGDASSGGGDADEPLPCGLCVLEPGDVIALQEERAETPEMGTPEYVAFADACSAVVLDRVMPPDPESVYNHTILITEGGPWWEARFVHATDPDAGVLDLITYEGLTAALAFLGEFAWDFNVFGVTEWLYSMPRYCGVSRVGTEDCGTIRDCNLCPEPGLGTAYCSELAWTAYGGRDGESAGGSLPAGPTGLVPDLYEHTSSVMTTLSHTSNDLARNFVLACPHAPFDELRLVDAECPGE